MARMEEIRNTYKILVRVSEEKRQLGKRRHRWDDNIKMDLKDTVSEGVDWIDLAQDRDQ